MATVYYGWHFLPVDRRLRYGDGRTVYPGKTLEASAEAYKAIHDTLSAPDSPALCGFGMHASCKLLSALHYAPGTILCYVKLHDTVSVDFDKAVAQKRTVIAMDGVFHLLIRTYFDALKVAIKLSNRQSQAWIQERLRYVDQCKQTFYSNDDPENNAFALAQLLQDTMSIMKAYSSGHYWSSVQSFHEWFPGNLSGILNMLPAEPLNTLEQRCKELLDIPDSAPFGVTDEED